MPQVRYRLWITPRGAVGLYGIFIPLLASIRITCLGQDYTCLTHQLAAKINRSSRKFCSSNMMGDSNCTGLPVVELNEIYTGAILDS